MASGIIRFYRIVNIHEIHLTFLISPLFKVNFKKYDIIIAALGISKFLTGDMVKDGVTAIDVGITRVDDATKKRGFRLAGDVHFDNVGKKASLITPVPGGVGPMTITMLLKNTLLSCSRNRK